MSGKGHNIVLELERARNRATVLERRIRGGCCTVDVRAELARTLALLARLEART